MTDNIKAKFSVEEFVRFRRDNSLGKVTRVILPNLPYAPIQYEVLKTKTATSGTYLEASLTEHSPKFSVMNPVYIKKYKITGLISGRTQYPTGEYVYTIGIDSNYLEFKEEDLRLVDPTHIK